MWKVNKDFTLPISTLIIFYFTLAGAFIFPLDSFLGYKGTAIGLHYLAIFDRLFPVAFDIDYIISCAYYVLFILVFQYTYILFVKKIVRVNKINNQTEKLPYEVIINPYMVSLVSFICIFISAFILRHEIYNAIAQEKSIYVLTRANKNSYYTIHQLANEFAVLIPFIAYTFTVVKSNKFNIRVEDKKAAFYILLVTCIISSLYISCLGNRREILSGLVFCTLISLNHFKDISLKRFGYIFMIVLTFFLANNFFRLPVVSKQLNNILHLERSGSFIEAKKEPKSGAKEGPIASVVFSNELFYAHFSMYGVIHKNIPLTYGSSFVSLVTSVIPRAINPNRPKDIYQYYVDMINPAPGQIYTIHHVAAYYLNFGFFGVVLAGFILAGFFIFAFFIDFYSFKKNGTFLILLKCLIPFLICGQLLTFITAGPEGYKSMFLEGILIPVFLLWICSKKTTSI
jgi:hypothetical protein